MLSIFVIFSAFLRLSGWKLPLPQWLRPFVQEPEIYQHGLAVRHKYHFRSSSYLLLLLSILGGGAQIAGGIYPFIRRDMIFPAASWLVILTIIVLEQPVTTPFGILVLNISLLASQTIALVDGGTDLDYAYMSKHALLLAPICASFASIVVIFLMPMRHPMLQHDEISTPFTTPNSGLRTPEDNMTLWQWATVSWIEPVLSLSGKQEINGGDVWALGYDYKHALLHEKFRQLEGSVFQRLMKANGLEILITAVLGVCETLCCRYFPQFLTILSLTTSRLGIPSIAAADLEEYAR